MEAGKSGAKSLGMMGDLRVLMSSIWPDVKVRLGERQVKLEPPFRYLVMASAIAQEFQYRCYLARTLLTKHPALLNSD
jgi:hypothetical protein